MVGGTSKGPMGTMNNEEKGDGWITFALVFGTEAVLPTKDGLPTITTLVAEDVQKNQRQLARNLDLLEEVRECAHVRRVAYQHKARSLYDKKAKIRLFIEGEWAM